MATDEQCETAYRQLRPYCDGVVSPDNLELLYSDLENEPYYTLSWLIADILTANADVPADLLLDAYAMLEDEDREEYRPLVERWTASRHT